MNNIPHEHNEQVALFQWAAYSESSIPQLRYLFAIPNGGHRHKAVAARMKAEGVKAGVPDIFLAYPTGEYCGLFIEMKFGTNKPTEKQNEWLSMLERAGYMTVVCYGFEDAKREILEYLEAEENTGE